MRLLFWKALVGLAMFDLTGLGSNFAHVHRLVKGWRVRPRNPAPDVTEQVCDAVNHASIWYPKRVLCLQRSTVTTCLLRSCGVSASLVVGAQQVPFRAHAWTEVNGQAINERR